MQKQGPSLWVCDAGPALAAGALLGGCAGSLCRERGALAAGPACGTDRGMPGSPSRAWTPRDSGKGETCKFWLARGGSWLPVSRQGCWHPTEPQVELHNQDLGGLRQAPVILSMQEGGTIAAPECSRKGRKKGLGPICSKTMFYNFFLGSDFLGLDHL